MLVTNHTNHTNHRKRLLPTDSRRSTRSSACITLRSSGSISGTGWSTNGFFGSSPSTTVSPVLLSFTTMRPVSVILPITITATFSRSPTASINARSSRISIASFSCNSAPHTSFTHIVWRISISAPFGAEISFTFPLPVVSTSSLFSQQWVVVRLEGQQHELMHPLAGQSHSGGKAEISKP